MINASFVLSPDTFHSLYDDATLSRLSVLAHLHLPEIPSATWREHRATLAKTDVIFSGWGAPVMDEEFLAAAPRLKMVFYAAGSVRYLTSDAFWKRNVRITAAHSINAIPVSEYTTSVLLLGLKRFWHFARQTREQHRFDNSGPLAGAFRSTVGLISYGTIARQVRERLRASAVNVLVYDPYLRAEAAQEEDVKLATLEEIFATCDAVSVHTPLREDTTSLIKGRHFESMKSGALFINTARGKIVDHSKMIEVLHRRPDLQIVLDVTDPEPLEVDSPLYRFPNVIITPHIAGSLGQECARMGQVMADEFERYIKGEPLLWELQPDKVAGMA